MKVLAIVVVYYPEIKDLTSNIGKIIDNVDRLIIWDNTHQNDSVIGSIGAFNSSDKIVLMGNGTNMGIAYALNQALEQMFNSTRSFTHLLTMDQDSTWVNFKDYLSIINTITDDAIYSPNINGQLLVNDKLTEVKTCITSGALFSKNILRVIRNFNEEYSVDCVDYDFCFKAKNKGMHIVKIPSAKMMQIYGEPTKISFFNLKNSEYSSKRLYFIARNHILLWRDYPAQIDVMFMRNILISLIFGKIVKVTFMEKNKIEKIFSILNGFFAGLINNRTRKY